MPLIRPGGQVLDLAAGGGRHAALLRAAGFGVVAADRDATRLRAVLGADAGCRIVEEDLETGGPWRLGGGYDGIVVTNYLHRLLLPHLAASLAPEGVLIYETFMIGNERLGKPACPDFLLRPGELIDAFRSVLTIVAFEQGIVDAPRPACIQRVAAVCGPAVDGLPPRLP